MKRLRHWDKKKRPRPVKNPLDVGKPHGSRGMRGVGGLVVCCGHGPYKD